MQNKFLEISILAALKAGDEILRVYNDPNSDFEIERKSDNSPLTKADKISHSVITRVLTPFGLPILSEEGRDIAFAERKKWQRFWMVDPIDGTKEFIKKNGEFTVNIALIENESPVLGVIYTPVTRELYFGAIGEGAFKIDVDLDNYVIEKIVSEAKEMPCNASQNENLCRVVASRSHLSEETKIFIKDLESKYQKIELLSKGSSLKICLVAEGKADIYPRFAPTMEWDTAAGDAILRSLQNPKALFNFDTNQKLQYNKENLLNPYFITADES